MKTKTFAIFMILFAVIFTSCKKETNDLTYGPYRDVYFYNYTSDTLDVHINGSAFTLKPGGQTHFVDEGNMKFPKWGKEWKAYLFIPYQPEKLYASGITTGRNIIE